MIRRPPRSTPFPTRRSSDLEVARSPEVQRRVDEIDQVFRAFERIVARGQQDGRSEEHTSELQSRRDLVCRLLLEKKKQKRYRNSIQKNERCSRCEESVRTSG